MNIFVNINFNRFFTNF